MWGDKMVVIAIILGTVIFWRVIKSGIFEFYSFKTLGSIWMICCVIASLIVGILGEGIAFLIISILPIIKWAVLVGVVVIAIKFISQKVFRNSNDTDTTNLEESELFEENN